MLFAKIHFFVITFFYGYVVLSFLIIMCFAKYWYIAHGKSIHYKNLTGNC